MHRLNEKEQTMIREAITFAYYNDKKMKENNFIRLENAISKLFPDYFEQQ